MKSLIMGNEAVACGALKAGMTFFAAYPITPASEIMHELADKEPEIAFVHAEDEIASIHMALGASLAGRKAMTSTSGPGMSLKQEGIGLAHMMEVPLVVVNVQRVGPSTGMPTLPAQGDILQAAHGSHGDYVPIVLYPSSVEECYRTTIEAFNAAEDSRSPVILLLDGYIAHLQETVDLDAIEVEIRPRTLAPLGQGRRHFTGLLARDGVPRTKDTAYYREWYARVKTKMLEAAAQYRLFDYQKNPSADTLIICYGITHRVVSPLRDSHSLFKPVRMFPVLEDEIRAAAAEHDKIVVVEMNDGQYRGEVQKVLRREVLGISILGGTISLKEIRERLREL
ncbi:MAG TPA: 2-oxoacid:acceptor oxidoreductase subunit alpha [Candidatus Latescibacteria bacterium]|nr:2-oxoacid:acceptor oxidoreductase subunit alpha [Candidatus Latescibacterota bacterium]